MESDNNLLIMYYLFLFCTVPILIILLWVRIVSSIYKEEEFNEYLYQRIKNAYQYIVKCAKRGNYIKGYENKNNKNNKNKFKRIINKIDFNNVYDVNDWETLLRTTYQDYIILDNNKIVFIDGPSSMSLFPTFGLDYATLMHIKQFAEITEYKKWKNNNFKEFFKSKEYFYKYNYEYNYPNYDDVCDPKKYVINICPNTMRPYTFDLQTNEYWKQKSEKLFGPLNNQLHAYIYYANFVKKYKKYPSQDELIYYIYKRQSAKGITTLPRNIKLIVEKLIYSYNLVNKNITPEHFKYLFNNSENNIQRNYLEQIALDVNGSIRNIPVNTNIQTQFKTVLEELSAKTVTKSASSEYINVN